MTDKSWRVVVVDRYDIVRNGVRSVLEQVTEDVEIVGEALNATDALRVCRETDANLVVLDLDAPDMDAVPIIAQIKEEMPSVAVLAFSARDDEDAVVEVIRAGASGFLPKSATLQEIRAILRSLSNDSLYLTSKFAPKLRRMLGAESKRAEQAERAATMTPREKEIIEYLSRGYSARMIARELGISERTVNTHVGNLYRRLGVNNRVDAVLAAMRMGLVELNR